MDKKQVRKECQTIARLAAALGAAVVRLAEALDDEPAHPAEEDRQPSAERIN